MKKSVCFVIVFLLFVSALFSQTLEPVIDDLSNFFYEFGKETLIPMFQNELSGCGIGNADFDDDDTFYFGASLGANLTNGIFKFVNEENSAFDLLDVNYFVSTIMEDAPDFVGDGYDFFQTFFLFPNFRLAAGFPFFFDTEMTILFSILPGILTDWIADLAAYGGLEASSLNAGIRLRKVLLKDAGWFPAISLGLGYTFSYFHINIPVPEFEQDMEGDILRLSGTLFLDNMLNTVGVDLNLSKKFGIFVPFVKLSPYFQWASYHGGMSDFYAEIEDSIGDTIVDSTTSPEGEIFLYEISMVLTFGFELVFGDYILFPYSTFDLSTNNVTVNLEMRSEF
ncbi:MAG: hypothetical protein JW881_11355 [Spirochaetales bacterium]|nr:hypothetical protein [Spirochaetales bacterium]